MIHIDLNMIFYTHVEHSLPEIFTLSIIQKKKKIQKNTRPTNNVPKVQVGIPGIHIGSKHINMRERGGREGERGEGENERECA